MNYFLDSLSDLHFDHVEATGPEFRNLILPLLLKTEADSLWITGDIATSSTLAARLQDLAEVFDGPIYFVLGNHDYYGSSVKEVQDTVRGVCDEITQLIWMNEAGVVELGDGHALVGAGGWADAKAGSGTRSTLRLRDHILIEDLSNRGTRFLNMAMLAGEEAYQLEENLNAASAQSSHVTLLTHVPPFPQSVQHMGQIAGSDYQSYYCSIASRDAIRAAAQSHPDVSITVLCGHTHGQATYAEDNITVHTAEVEYGQPWIQAVFPIGSPQPIEST